MPAESPVVEAPTPSRWRKPALLAVVALAALGFFGRNLLLGKPVDALEVVRSDLVQTVVASGRVVTPQRVSIGVEVTGRVGSIPVQEGQSVKRGQSLIVLEDQDERATVAQAAAAVAQAEAKVRQLREVGLPTAEQNRLQAEANVRQLRRVFERNRELQAKGFIGQAALDDSQRNLEVAESQLRTAQVQVQSNAPRGSETALAFTALEQARASHALALARLAQHNVRAPADGVLIGRSVEPGTIVQPGKELMVLAPAGETQLVVQIDEKNLAKLALGQKALASADAYPGQRFGADLVYINPGVDAARGAVEVKLRVPAPPATLRQDMTVSVDIEVARRTDVVVMPTEALRDGAGAKPWALAVRDGHALAVPLKLGLRGDGRVEVLEGLAAGDLLVPPSNGLVKAGQRVRAVVKP
jgi:HlyD family secretion protein